MTSYLRVSPVSESVNGIFFLAMWWGSSLSWISQIRCKTNLRQHLVRWQTNLQKVSCKEMIANVSGFVCQLSIWCPQFRGLLADFAVFNNLDNGKGQFMKFYEKSHEEIWNIFTWILPSSLQTTPTASLGHTFSTTLLPDSANKAHYRQIFRWIIAISYLLSCRCNIP